MFISFLCMFRSTMCPSSGETTVFMWHLVLVTLYGWLSGMQGIPPSIPDSHSYRITCTKCRIKQFFILMMGTYVIARNTYRVINMLIITHTKKKCAPSWFYLQAHTGLHGQQNIKLLSSPNSNRCNNVTHCIRWMRSPASFVAVEKTK